MGQNFFKEKIKVLKLKNGLNIVFFEKHDLPIVNVNLWLKVGSKDETIKNSGISHFLEHILFKNTKNYPNNSISKEIENIGGQMNAATSYDFTHYYITLHSNDVEKAFSVISDMAFNLEIEKEGFEMEKGVILEEIQMYKDHPTSVLWEEIYKNFFGIKNFVYERPIIGTKKNILRMTKEDLKDYYDENYIPENMTLFVAGNLKMDDLEKLSRKHFDIKKNSIEKVKNIQDFHLNSSDVCKNFISNEKIMDTINQTYFSYTWNAPNISNLDDFVAVSAFSKILGEGISSKLHKTLKQDLNLVWTICSGIAEQKYGSVFAIYGTAEYKNLDKIELEIFNLLSNLEKDIIQDDLLKVKTIADFNFFLDFETMADISDNLGYFEVMKDWRLFFELKEKTNNLKLQDILYAKDLIFGKINKINKTEKFFLRQIVRPKNLE